MLCVKFLSLFCIYNILKQPNSQIQAVNMQLGPNKIFIIIISVWGLPEFSNFMLFHNLMDSFIVNRSFTMFSNLRNLIILLPCICKE